MIHINFNKFEPFSLNQKEKYFFFFNEIKKLTNHHYTNSEEFKKILNFTNKKNNYKNLEDVPFLPIHLFKEYELMSVPKNKIFKTLNSSGTPVVNNSRFLPKFGCRDDLPILKIFPEKALLLITYT